MLINSQPDLGALLVQYLAASPGIAVALVGGLMTAAFSAGALGLQYRRALKDIADLQKNVRTCAEALVGLSSHLHSEAATKVLGVPKPVSSVVRLATGTSEKGEG